MTLHALVCDLHDRNVVDHASPLQHPDSYTTPRSPLSPNNNELSTGAAELEVGRSIKRSCHLINFVMSSQPETDFRSTSSMVRNSPVAT